MNARELLKEARGELAKAHDHLMELTAKLPMQYFGLVDGNIIQAEDCLISQLDAYLAAPSESAMEMVEKIREPTMISPTDVSMVPEGLAITYRTDWKLTKSDAAELIEGLQRRVPSALFDEIIEIQPLSYAKLGRAFVKHGVRCEP